METSDWAGVVIGAIGVVLLVNLGGITRGFAHLLGELKESFGSLFVAMPTTTWGLRLLGAGLVVFGAAVVVSASG